MGWLLRMVVLAAALYIGYSFGAPRVRAWRFQEAMKQTARLAEASDERAMKDALLDSARDLGVPLSPYRLEVQDRGDGGVAIRARWHEVVRIEGWRLGEWVDTLRFDYQIGEL